MPQLPSVLRRATPDRLRHSPVLRGVALRAGLVPPRVMHSPEEGAQLRALARGARRVVEIGVYEGGSAVALVEELGAGAELHLIDPYGEQPGALPAGWGATEPATKAVVARAAKRKGGQAPRVTWHVALSHDVAQRWSAGPVDLVFVDGDHLLDGVLTDWEDWRELVAPGGHLVFHDAREGKPDGRGLPGPTQVVDEHLRVSPPPGWSIVHEVHGLVTARRHA